MSPRRTNRYTALPLGCARRPPCLPMARRRRARRSFSGMASERRLRRGVFVRARWRRGPGRHSIAKPAWCEARCCASKRSCRRELPHHRRHFQPALCLQAQMTVVRPSSPTLSASTDTKSRCSDVRSRRQAQARPEESRLGPGPHRQDDTADSSMPSSADRPRYARRVGLIALANKSSFTLLGNLFLAIGRFGTPKAIRTDNESGLHIEFFRSPSSCSASATRGSICTVPGRTAASSASSAR